MIALDLRTRFGRLRAQLDAPERPMRLAELAWNTLSLDERLIKKAVQVDLADGTRFISCQKGCGACCRQIVPLSPPEAWMIADVVAGMPPDRQSRVLERFQTLFTTLAKGPMAKRVITSNDTAADMHAFARDYFALGEPCPFLEDESCSIHPERPSVCREYLVTSPATECIQLETRATRRVPTAMRMSEALGRVTAKVLNKPIEIVPMHAAPYWAKANEEDGKRTFDGKMLLEMFVAEAQAVQLELEPTTESAP